MIRRRLGWRAFRLAGLVACLLLAGHVLSSSVTAREPCQAASVKYRDGPVCLNRGFEFQGTAKSSWIDGAWYDRAERYFLINLQGTLYHYCRFPPELWNAFKAADSYGRFYNAQIKGRYDCRLGGVPRYEE